MRKLILLCAIIFSHTIQAQYVDYIQDDGRLIGPNTTLNLAFHQLKTMMVAHDVPLTTPAADGTGISTVYDQSINGLILRQTVQAARPVLGSDGTRTSFLDFDGTDANLKILSSLSFFNKLWVSVPFGTICMWFNMQGGDGVSQMLMSSTDLTTDAGFQILRANSNKLIVRAGDGDPVTGGADLSWTITSTDDITTADGWVGMICSINGTGASAGRLILMNSSGTIFNDQTFAVVTGSDVNAQADTYIGARADVTTPDLFADAYISTIICENFPVHDGLIDEFKNYNPARTTDDFEPIIQYRYDVNNNAFVFEDAAGTDLAEDGDAVRIIRNSVLGNYNVTSVGSALRRNASTTSSGTSPTYQTNEINGRSVLDFDGSDDNMDFLNVLFEEGGGKNTFFAVVRNDDVSLGSHFLSGSNYVVLTGSGYSSGAGFTYPYFVFHHSVVGADIGQESENAGVDDYKIIAYRRDGSALSAWNGDKVKNTDTSSELFTITDMGIAHAGVGPTWNCDCQIAYFSKYNGVMTDAQIEAEIDRLKSEYGLFIVPFFGGLVFLRRKKSKGVQLMEDTFKQAA